MRMERMISTRTERMVTRIAMKARGCWGPSLVPGRLALTPSCIKINPHPHSCHLLVELFCLPSERTAILPVQKKKYTIFVREKILPAHFPTF